jgi:hypothetical protein
MNAGIESSTQISMKERHQNILKAWWQPVTMSRNHETVNSCIQDRPITSPMKEEQAT